MKNKFLKGVAFAMAAALFPVCTGCDVTDNGKKKIVTTIAPEYDWVMNVLGDKKDNYDVKMLLDSGVDLHSYSPSPADIVAITNADLFIYVGGESDDWVEETLKQSKNENMQVINLLETLGDDVKEEEVKEGMEGHDHDHEHGDDDDDDHDHEGEDHDHEGEDHDHEGEDHDHEGEDHDHEGEDHDHEEGHEHHHEDGEKEYDEHVWLSLKSSQKFVTKISECLSTIDADNAATFKDNAKKYNDSLKELDGKYTSAVNAGTKKTVLFADRFPFRYLVDDYGLDYYAAFVGCSAETEASFETIKFLAEKVDELGLSVILQIESSDGKIANTVKNATTNKNQTILTMDSAQTTTTKQFADGRTYLSIMEGNLDVLKQALK